MIQLEVLYPSTRRPSPLKELHSVGASVPIGTRGKVYVRGRNDMATTQKLGIRLIIQDPDGIVVRDDQDWESWPNTAPGDDHQFISGGFDIDKPGDWLIGISLAMNPKDPVTVDSYAGVLCTARVGVVAEFQNFRISSYDGVVAGEKIELAYDDTLKVNISFDYRGPGETVTLYGAIGNSGFPGEELLDEGSFLKRLTGEQSIDLPQSLEFTPVAASVDIPITTEISSYTNYDLYVKLVEYRKEAGMPKIDNIIDILPTYELIQHTIYPYAYIYDGDVEVTTATFKTDPFSPVAWIADKFASKLEEEVRARGGRPIEVKVYVDKAPLLWTDFRIEVVGTPLAGVASGIAVSIPVWLAIILVCLAFIALIVVATLAIKTVVGLFKTYPGLKDMKPGWGKETLMLAIHDSEVDFERPLTPIETLEGMSEAELRDLLDKIAEEEVKPEVAWWPLAIIGGVAVLGVGAAVALTAAKPRE